MPQVNPIAGALLAQRGHLFPWVPVCLAAGIGAYFAVPFEPSPAQLAGLAALALLAAALALRAGAAAPLFWALALVAAGVLLASARAHMVSAPVLGWRYYGPVEGRVVGIDRSASDALRLTLDRVVLERVSPARTPGRVRVSLHGAAGARGAPDAGARVLLTAHLSPPGGPVEPGGFDFRRHAWFQGVGAVGYSRTPLMLWERPGRALPVLRARLALSTRVQAALPGEVGAFAAAVMTGDRSGMGQETLAALRVSNLAHLLAISGLHMGLLAGFVFASARLGFAAVPALGLRLPAKKISAVLALLAAAGYLALSGGNIATERAFVMVAVALVAVILERRALTLRAVAVAAVIVLLLRPEQLLGPGFQMSFAATTALVAVFAWLRDTGWRLNNAWARRVLAVALSSAVAGLATAPVGAAHFNQVAHYGLAANLAAVPLMGVLVMPAAVLAALLMPLGLEALPLWAMAQGLGWILGVAHVTAGLEGARGAVISPHWAVLPALALGALWLILWQGRARMAGLAVIALAFLGWSQSARPPILVAESGGLIGVMTAEGRALNRPRGGGFVAMNWLENDGDLAGQAGAAARWPGEDAPALGPLRAVRGKRAEAALTGCAPGEVLILTVAASRDYPCTVFDAPRLREAGALAAWPDGAGGLRIVSARALSGRRLWSP